MDPSFTTSTSSTYNPSDAPVSDVSNIGVATGFPYPYSGGNSPLRSAGMESWDYYWMAFLGNVLGESGVTTGANGWSYQAVGSNNKIMWMLGWKNGGGYDTNLTGAGGGYFFRHGNYDYYNNAINDSQTGYSHTLQNSFNLSSAPAFFSAGASCSYSWPWLTPTGTSQIQPPTGPGSCTSYSGLPAKARWDAGTPFVQP